MLSVQTLVVGDLDTNCYLLSSQHQCLIIDPGDAGDFISQTIIENKLVPLAIILTHGHFDHVLGCLELVLNFSLPVLINQSDQKLYLQANKSALHWQGREGDPVPKTIRYLKDGDTINLEEESLKVIATPGHTPGSLCLYSKGLLFTGDTLFKEGVGRTDFSYSNPLMLEKSLNKIGKLPPHTVIYPGHGPQTTIGAVLVGDNSGLH